MRRALRVFCTGAEEAITDSAVVTGAIRVAKTAPKATASGRTGAVTALVGRLTGLAEGARRRVVDVTSSAVLRGLLTTTCFTGPPLRTDRRIVGAVGLSAAGAAHADLAASTICRADTLTAAAVETVWRVALACTRLIRLARSVAGGALTVGVTGLTGIALTIIDAAHTGAQRAVPVRGLNVAGALGGVFADAVINLALTVGQVADLVLGAAVGHPSLIGAARGALTSGVVAVGAGLAAASLCATIKGAFDALVLLSVAGQALWALAAVTDALVLGGAGLLGGAARAVAAAIGAGVVGVAVLAFGAIAAATAAAATDARVGADLAIGAVCVARAALGRIDALAGEVADLAVGAVFALVARCLFAQAVRRAGLGRGAVIVAVTLGARAALRAIGRGVADLAGEAELTVCGATDTSVAQTDLPDGAWVVVCARNGGLLRRIIIATSAQRHQRRRCQGQPQRRHKRQRP